MVSDIPIRANCPALHITDTFGRLIPLMQHACMHFDHTSVHIGLNCSQVPAQALGIDKMYGE